ADMRKLLVIIISLVVLISCDNFLDVKPAGRLIPQSGDVASFDKLLNNVNTIDWVFQNNNRGSILPFLCDDIQISNNQADYAWYNGHPNIDCYFGHTFKTPYANPAVQDYYWNWGFYRAAQYFNSCIDGVNSVKTPDTETAANEVIAQATVARAWSYFNAALGYGPVYKPGADNSAKVIPYRTSSDVLAPMEDLSTMQEVFDKVLSDIHSNMKNIPANVTANTRFGKVQTYAFLAYIHLFTAKYDSVAYYADQALTLAASQKGGMDNLFYNMNNFSWADSKVATNRDTRYSSSINTSQGSDPLTATYNREICLYRTVASVGSSSTYPSQEFNALFDPATDLRSEYFFFEYLGYKTTVSGVVYDDGRRIQNYQTKVARTSGYTYPEILLMRAEGRARTNNVTGALADLNYLRKFRHKTGTPDLVITSKDAAIQEIVNERRRELPMGSPKRFFDLKRFCLETGKTWCKTSITHTVKGQPYTANIDSKFFILPISNDVLRWNTHWGIPLEETPWSNNK
ncbi:MAG: RagB/SusD family nutrient uptake outer membrane protein, partial [Bacteroidales bacterium]|nr:RagB/SusD family nutrient uptake outer membrane protein [Bacteroidales bacterium]